MTFKCEFCNGYETKTKGNYKRHLTSTKHLKNTGAVSKFHHCDQCDYKSNRKSNMKLHVQRKHNENTTTKHRFKCTLCNKTFRDKYNLKVHTKSKLHYVKRLRALNEDKKNLNKMDSNYNEKVQELLKKHSQNIVLCDVDIQKKTSSNSPSPKAKPETRKITAQVCNENKLIPRQTVKQAKQAITEGLKWLEDHQELDSVDVEYYQNHKEEMSLEELNDFVYEIYDNILDVLNE